MCKALKFFLPLVCLAVAPALHAADQPPDEKKWQVYSFSEDGFSISAPSKPDLQKVPQGNLENHNYTITLADGRSLVISVTDTKQGEKLDPKRALQGGKNGFAGNLNLKVTSEKEVQLQGQAGLEFEGESAQWRTRCRLYVVKGTIFHLISIGPASMPVAAETERIFDSFKLLGVPVTQVPEKLQRDVDRMLSTVARETPPAAKPEGSSQAPGPSTSTGEPRVVARINLDNPNEIAGILGKMRKEAEAGDPKAQYSYAAMFALGKDSLSLEQRAFWLRKAAEQGHPQAQRELGLLYLSGKGVAQNKAEAAAWFRKAAEQGDNEARYQLGHMYREENREEAKKWLRLSAAQGHLEAQYELAKALDSLSPRDRQSLFGSPSVKPGQQKQLEQEQHEWEKDQTEAALWYQAAAEGGHLQAQFALASRQTKTDKVEALKWLYLVNSYCSGHMADAFCFDEFQPAFFQLAGQATSQEKAEALRRADELYDRLKASTRQAVKD